jgi:MFS-type transporter involved in bile tolerance (Atg22 family)
VCARVAEARKPWDAVAKRLGQADGIFFAALACVIAICILWMLGSFLKFSSDHASSPGELIGAALFSLVPLGGAGILAFQVLAMLWAVLFAPIVSSIRSQVGQSAYEAERRVRARGYKRP